MKFKADRYILEQIWKEFKDSITWSDRKNLPEFLRQFENTVIFSDYTGIGNADFHLFPIANLRHPLSKKFERWMKENYPEYLL